jgi:hypothetical protein
MVVASEISIGGVIWQICAHRMLGDRSASDGPLWVASRRCRLTQAQTRHHSPSTSEAPVSSKDCLGSGPAVNAEVTLPRWIQTFPKKA